MQTTGPRGSRRARAVFVALSIGLVLALAGALIAWRAHGRGVRSLAVAGATTPSPSPSPAPETASPAPTDTAPAPAALAAAPDPPPVPVDPGPVPTSSVVADALTDVPVSNSPGGPVVTHVAARNLIAQPEAFLVLGQQPGWLQVELPVKPNGSTGWIPASAVHLRTDATFIRVWQSQFRLEYYVGGQLLKSFSVAVGAPRTPTPNGNFFVWASEAYNHAPYTPGIFALSGFSPVLDNWPGGGRAGIHGWTDTSITGTRASHGCVRMRPADFAQILTVVPLGTPVQILP